MVRALLITAAAGIVLMLICFAGAAALGGPEIRNSDWGVINDRFVRIDRGPQAERTLEWNGTDTLTVSASLDVEFVQGDTPSVVVTGPQNVISRVTLTDGRIDLEGGEPDIVIQHHDDPIRVRVTAPDVSRFVVDGSGDLTLNGIDRDALDIRISGSGDVEAYGEARSVTLTIEGSGSADLDGLSATAATVRIDGSGDADVRASESADVEISGSGDVDLLGRPARVTQTINGSGEISSDGPAVAESGGAQE